jgi:hypothetical protein
MWTSSVSIAEKTEQDLRHPPPHRPIAALTQFLRGAQDVRVAQPKARRERGFCVGTRDAMSQG